MRNLQERERKRLHMDMIHVKTAIHKKMNKIEITDLTLPELQVYTSLNEAQLLHYYEPAPGIDGAEGFRYLWKKYHCKMQKYTGLHSKN